MSSSQTQRTALITGGAGGIGSEIGRQLARDGYRVVIADLIRDDAQAIADELEGTGHIAVRMDVADPEDVQRAFDEAEAAVGPVNVLVHAAAIMLVQEDRSVLRFWEFELDRWDKTMAVNARGTLLVSREYMQRRLANPANEGRLILFSSLSGQISGSRTYADYSASKAAVLGFMRAAAKDCAPLGITVNAIAPGFIETPMAWRNIGQDTPVNKDLIIMGRRGKPSDIADLVRYIADARTSFVTGATFDINGGQRMA